MKNKTALYHLRDYSFHEYQQLLLVTIYREQIQIFPQIQLRLNPRQSNYNNTQHKN